MLTNLTHFLETAIEYEDEKYCGENSMLLAQAQGMLEELIEALANMTGTDLAQLSGAMSGGEQVTDDGDSSASTAEESSSSSSSSSSGEDLTTTEVS